MKELRHEESSLRQTGNLSERDSEKWHSKEHDSIKTQRRMEKDTEMREDKGDKIPHSTMRGIAAMIVTLLVIGVSARPAPQLKHLKSLADLLSRDLSSSEELAFWENLEDLEGPQSGPRARDTPFPVDSAPLPPNRAWLRLFGDFMSNQKKFRGRTKKTGTSRGCFGMKLERIGAISGLGC
ncbi:C-type natriuretic peptide [Rhinophrynus dorsalis]